MILTSHSKLGNTGEKTGFWVEEFAAPYYAFIDAGIKVTLASVAGGQPPIDPKSELEDFQTAATKRYDQDQLTLDLMANTVTLSQVDINDFDGIFYPGGHGPLWDLVDNKVSIELITKAFTANKPVAAVCHASAVFLAVKEADGSSVLNGKAVTGFSNTEEDAVQLTDIVPFLLEDEMKIRGGEYQKVADWHPFVVQDGLIITGQNPASSALAAQKLLAHLG